MILREKLSELVAIIADEAERNSGFRRRLEEALVSWGPDLPVVHRDKAGIRKPRDELAQRADGPRKGGRRTPAVLDPVALARQSEAILRRDLAALNVEQLKDVVAENGMDPGKLVMKWKDSARIIDRIVDLSMARSTKGDAFRADKIPTQDSDGS
jgi:hypothetical protein